ncbi:MAG: hypothetical protein R2834_20050 [Rhodothermales bacterium]
MSSFPQEGITLTPRNVARTLIGATIVLVVLHLGGLALSYATGKENPYNIVHLIHMGREHNLPTYFSTMLLLFSATLFILLARVRKQVGAASKPWSFLGLVFLFLSVDEFAELHERLTNTTREMLHATGALYYAWIIPYGLLVLGLTITYAPLIFRLESAIRNRLILSAILYVGGAVGMESIEAAYIEGKPDGLYLIYDVLSTFEELLEIAGVILLIYTLLLFIQRHPGGITVRVPGADTSA